MKSLSHSRIINRFAKILSVLIVIASLFGFTQQAVLAQSQTLIESSKPDISSYPDLSVLFRVFESSGAFVKNLDIASVHIIENNQIIAPDSLEMLEQGVRLVVAVNEGPTLANRYAQVTRIDRFKSALTSWAEQQPITTMDDFSLVTNTGVVASRLTKPDDWINTLENYQPEMKQLKPGLSSLSAAIDMATDTTGAEDKTSAILYFTPLPTEDQNAGFEDLISRAKIGNVRLFIILAGPQTYASEDQAELLRRAAEETGGQFVVFSGMEELPDFSTYFDPLTYVYRAVYHTKIKTSGDFSFSIRVNQGQTVLESSPLTFTLNAMQPNPIFLSPPSSVERTWTETEKRKDSVLTPDAVNLQIMIEFPDGLERDLVYSRLFVDNRLVDENTSAPFDSFEWDIRSLTESGSHTISVTIEDTAGFIVETVELSVEVVVQPKPQTWFEKIFSTFSAQTIILFVVIFAAGFLLVSLAIRTLRINRKTKQHNTHRFEDPLTQPVIIENEVIHPKSKTTTQNQWPNIPGSGLAPARLILQSSPVSESDLPDEIPVGNMSLTFGSDAKKSKVVLQSAAVSGLHARISQDDQGHFRLHDEGSGSGTWLNYAPVSQFGAKLEHGDLVQFGPISYRFEIYGTQPRKFKVETIKEE